MKTAAAVLAGLLIAGAALAAGALRDWTSSSGAIIQAQFVKCEGDRVYLCTRAGKTVSIPLTKLSADDQAYVGKLSGVPTAAPPTPAPAPPAPARPVPPKPAPVKSPAPPRPAAATLKPIAATPVAPSGGTGGSSPWGAPRIPPNQVRGEKAQNGGTPRIWKNDSELASVVSATFLGGSGHEWLCGGGFRQDGVIVLAGNTLSPSLELGVKAAVIGTDGSKPSEPSLPAKDRRGRLPLLSWQHENATGFIVHCAPNLKGVLSVHRLPWTSGAITGTAVAPDGAIYICGRANSHITKLGGDVKKLEPSPITVKRPKCGHSFLAKLSPDGAKCEWLRHIEGPSCGPMVRLLKDGNVKLVGHDIRTFDPDGALVQTTAVPGGLSGQCTVNPNDGTYVRGGEHHWGTGREPWRCPILNTFLPDGSHQYHFYDWGGPYVGLDNCRLVSDSAVRMVQFDADGNLIIVGWSDGGNSCFTREPTDIRSGVKPRGLGWNSAGAGVLSIQYIIKIEPKNYSVTGWTLWISFYGNKPNSTSINTLGWATDGSVCIGAGSAWGLVQTSNKLLGEGEPAGNHIAVLNRDMSNIRFSSALVGAGSVIVGEGSSKGASWGIVSGTVRGKPMVLFLSGAVPYADVYGWVSETPTKNPMQAKYGGGWLDGYAVLLDLSGGRRAETDDGALDSVRAATAKGCRPPSERPAAVATFLAALGGICVLARRRGRGVWLALLIGLTILALTVPSHAKKESLPPPEPGTTFHFLAAYPKYVSVDSEFRDPAGKLWPNFMYGKPVEGTLVWDPAGFKAKLTVQCDRWCQPRGDQSRRVVGELIKDDKSPPLITFILNSLGPLKKETITTTDSRGRKKTREEQYAIGDGVLQVGEVKIPVKPRCIVGLSKGRDSSVWTHVRLTANFTIKGSQLGLKNPDAQGDITVKVSCTGTKESAAPPKEKR